MGWAGGWWVAWRPRRGAERAARAAMLAAAAVAGLFIDSGPARAQPTRQQEMAVLGINALVAGGTSGLAALARGRPVLRAFGQGLAAGVVIYGAKRVASMEQLALSGLAGRLMSAAGTSMVRNGAAGRGAFEMLVIPLGPLTLYRRPESDSAHAPVKLHLVRTAFLAVLLLRDDAKLDWRETMHSGTPVFTTPGRVIRSGYGWATAGAVICGTVILSDFAVLPEANRGVVVTHERIHVLQDDFVSAAWTGPVESRLLALLPGGRRLARWVDVGALHVGAIGAAHAVLPYERRPWEMEAEHFEARR